MSGYADEICDRHPKKAQQPETAEPSSDDLRIHVTISQTTLTVRRYEKNTRGWCSRVCFSIDES